MHKEFNHFFKKTALIAFTITSVFGATACSMKTVPGENPVAEHQIVSAVSEEVTELNDAVFVDEELAGTAIENLEDLTDKLGYRLEAVTLVRVVDGDTLVVDYNGEECKLRLIGVNTPESVASKEYLEKTGKENTKEGKVASEWVKDLLKNHETLYIQKDTSETDKYGRLLRYVWLEVPEDTRDIDEIKTKMLNGVLLDAGLAEVTIYRPDVEYADAFQAIYTQTTDDFEWEE